MFLVASWMVTFPTRKQDERSCRACVSTRWNHRCKSRTIFCFSLKYWRLSTSKDLIQEILWHYLILCGDASYWRLSFCSIHDDTQFLAWFTFSDTVFFSSLHLCIAWSAKGSAWLNSSTSLRCKKTTAIKYRCDWIGCQVFSWRVPFPMKDWSW